VDRDEVLRVFAAAFEYVEGPRGLEVFGAADGICGGLDARLGLAELFMWLTHIHKKEAVYSFVRRPPLDGFGYDKWDVGTKAPRAAVACLLKNQQVLGCLFSLDGSVLSWREVVGSELRAELSRLVVERWRPVIRV